MGNDADAKIHYDETRPRISDQSNVWVFTVYKTAVFLRPGVAAESSTASGGRIENTCAFSWVKNEVKGRFSLFRSRKKQRLVNLLVARVDGRCLEIPITILF